MWLLTKVGVVSDRTTPDNVPGAVIGNEMNENAYIAILIVICSLILAYSPFIVINIMRRKEAKKQKNTIACNQCGKKIEKDSIYCKYCGNKIK